MLAPLQHGESLSAAKAELCIAEADLRHLFAAAAKAWPGEICGLLRGRRIDRRNFVSAALLLPNQAAAGDRFRIDPLALLRAESAATAAGEVIVGVLHSHPGPDLRPSLADQRSAALGYGAGYSWLIVSAPPGHLPQARSWRPLAARPGFGSEAIVVGANTPLPI